ncbi:MAG: MFS transporter [Oscillospiraceae bacterium]|nr:MFS transporter [Oscillospiraceae bacterium]
MSIFTEFYTTVHNASKNVQNFMLCIFVNGLVMSALSVMLGIYYTNIGLSEVIIGNLLSVRTLGNSIGAFSAIFLVQNFGTKRALYASFSAMLVCGLVFTNITILPIMQAASFLFGVSQAIFVVVQAPFYKKYSDDKTVVGVFSASFVLNNIAMFTGSFLFGKFSDIFASFGGLVFGSKMVLNISFLLLAVNLIALSKIEFDIELNNHSRGRGGIKEYLAVLNRDSVLYMIKTALIGLGAGLIVPFFSVYIKHSLNTTDSVVGSIMAFAQFGTVLGGLLTPKLSRRFGRVKFVLICQLMSIPFLISISFPQGAFIMAISFFFRNSLMNMANPVLQSMAMDLVEEKHRTIMSSIFTLCDNLLRALGTQAGGIIMMAVSYNMPYYITVVLYLMSAVLIYCVFGRNEKYKNLR